MRYFVALVLALALGVMGCSETTGDGGSGGTGGMPECRSRDDCDDREECTTDACTEGACEYTPVTDGTACAERNECAVGECAIGACELTPIANGTACGDDAGTCQDSSCEVACDEQGILDAVAAGGGPYTFDCDGPTTVKITENLSAPADLILDGRGNLTIEGGGLRAGTEQSLELRGMAFSNLQYGIGVVAGALTIIDSQIIGSEADAIIALVCAESGCHLSKPGLTIRNTVISGAGATAIQVAGAGGTIEYSTIQDNLGDGVASCSLEFGGAPLTIRNTTISGNRGRGLRLCGDVTVSNSTVSGNLGEWAVSVVGCEDHLRIKNSTVSGDFYIEGYCNGGSPVTAEFRGLLMEGSCNVERNVERTSLGYNIESPGDTCGFDQESDMPDMAPEELNLGDLADNGGPTMTHALRLGSEAIDQIPAEACEVDTDQRGEERPVGDGCDIGAFERQPDDPE